MFEFLRGKKKIETNLNAYRKDVSPVVLLVLDGWGIAPESKGNAIAQAKTTNFDYYKASYPSGSLIASGESVGLSANEEGNSEVGHLTLGAGRVVPQSLVRINQAILDDSFYYNDAFVRAVEYVKSHNSTLHLAGLVGSGEVHSSMKHFWALLELVRKTGVSRTRLHLFCDGRDSPPREAGGIIRQIEEKISVMHGVKIADVSGRYYSMDRDRRWERTEKTYKAMVLGQGVEVDHASQAVDFAYAKNLSDEFIEPSVVVSNGSPIGLVQDMDAIIFFNFRIDRPREITMAFTIPDFENLKGFEFGYNPYHEEDKPLDIGFGDTQLISEHTFDRIRWPQGLFVVTMTEYQKSIPVSAVAFGPTEVVNSLPQVLSGKGLRQLHLAESEKERMVTYYFDGLREERLQGEDVLIVPSRKVSTYDKTPAMSTYDIVSKLQFALKEGVYNFVVLNFACPDMVAHTGKLGPTKKAIKAADKGIGYVAEMVLSLGGTLIVTADHGNAEELIKYSSEEFYFTTSKGEVDTKHSNNPVPVLIISDRFKGKFLGNIKGTLSDVAPTILNLMGISVPGEMKGGHLLNE